MWDVPAHHQGHSTSGEDGNEFSGPSANRLNCRKGNWAMKHIPAQVEPERYEFAAPPSYIFELDRREFFKLLGAGVLVVSAMRQSSAQESGRGGARGESLPQEIDAWLHIGENGRVTVYTGKVEVGQNIRTSLTQAVSEELRVAIRNIELVMGDTQLTPFDMGTFGSRTTPTMNLQLRKVSAAAFTAFCSCGV